MGQRRTEDKIGLLSHGGGIITMAASSSVPARLTIGGQQYKVTSPLTMNVGTATANTLYMIYAVLDSGSVTLVKSTNVNSVGPAGYNAWKLVGAFYTAAANTWGSFINIKGVPRSVNPYVLGVTSNFTTNNTLVARGQRDGNHLVVDLLQTFTGVPGAGTGQFTLPFTLDSSELITQSGGVPVQYSISRWDNSASRNIIGTLQYVSTTVLQFYDTLDDGTVTRIATTSIAAGTMASGDSIQGYIRVPISGWSNTPLEDL